MLLACHVTIDIVARYLGRPIAVTMEIGSYYYMVAVTFLPLAYAQYRNGHISVDFVVDALPAGPRTAISLMTSVLVLAFIVMIGWASYLSAVERTMRGAYTMTQHFDLPLWPSRWLPVIGLVAFALVVLEQIVTEIGRLLSRNDSGGAT